MAALIDFDREYMRYAALRLKGKGELKDAALEKALNDTMQAWLNEKADWLGGATPDEYFAGMDCDGLVKLMADYCAAGMSVPEPLYRQLAARSDSASALKAVVCDDKMGEEARSTALRILCDMNAGGVTDICVRLIASGSILAEMAAAWLVRAGYEVVEKLLAEYDAADDSAQEAMLDVMCYYPGVERTSQLLRGRLLADHERRAQHAAMAARLGDPALIEPLRRLAALSEISYYDYKEIINAIDSLGGDPGVERQFYGDPDYELMRNPDIGLPEDWRTDVQ